MTIYSVLLLTHFLALVVWLGGMFFALFCLRPAAIAVLPPPQRIPLLHGALGRFFRVVVLAITLLLVTGVGMVLLVGIKGMPLAWLWMIGLGAAMMTIFFHIRAGPFKRLETCVASQDWPAAGGHLEKIRVGVMLNLLIGISIVLIMKLGRA